MPGENLDQMYLRDPLSGRTGVWSSLGFREGCCPSPSFLWGRAPKAVGSQKVISGGAECVGTYPGAACTEDTACVS